MSETTHKKMVELAKKKNPTPEHIQHRNDVIRRLERDAALALLRKVAN